MAYTDIAIIVVILIGCLIGYFKGFFKSLASLLGTLVCLVLAFVLTTFTVDAIMSIGPLHSLLYGADGSLASAVSNALPVGMQDMTLGFAATEEGKAALTQALGGGVWSVFLPLILSIVTKFMGGSIDYSLTPVADCIGIIVARCVAWAVLFILYLIVLKIIAKLIGKIGTLLRRGGLSRSLDRVFGILIGGVKGLLFAIVALFVLGLASGLSFMAPYREDLNRSVIAKPLSEFTVNFLGSYVDIEKLTGGLVKPNHTEDGNEAETEQTAIGREERNETLAGEFGLSTEGLVWSIARSD